MQEQGTKLYSNSLNASCKIESDMVFNKCIIELSALLKKLYFHARRVQQYVYTRIGVYKQDGGFIYTNNFNLVLDTLFRMTYKLGVFLGTLKKKYKISTILIIDDVITKPDKYYEKLAKDKPNYTAIAHCFRTWCEYMNRDEEEDMEPMETYLSEVIPQSYNFNMRDIVVNRTTSIHEDNYKHDRFIALMNITRSISRAQTIITPAEVRGIFEFITNNLKTNKDIKMFKVNAESDFMCIYSLFPDEPVLYCVNKYYIKNPNVFYWSDDAIYYLMLNKKMSMNNIVVPIDEALSEIQTKVKEKSKITTFTKLLKLCSDECHFGVMDINSNYRYTFFENMKELIQGETLTILMPASNEDMFINWISIDEYKENLPQWIHQFNSFSPLKIKLGV